MGALKTQLKTDLTKAMKNRDTTAKSTIRMALAALMNAEVAGAEARELDDDEEVRIITREVRTREESARTYRDAGRTELADKESAEAAFLQRYLPQPLSPTELAELVDAEITATTEQLGAAPTMKQMGAIVKAVSARAGGRADGGAIAKLVKAALL